MANLFYANESEKINVDCNFTEKIGFMKMKNNVRRFFDINIHCKRSSKKTHDFFS